MREPLLDPFSSTRTIEDHFWSEMGRSARFAYGKIAPQCQFPVRTRIKGLQSMRPCGQCVHCKVSKRNQMVGRCVGEAYMQPSICVTLTIDDNWLFDRDWWSADVWTRAIVHLRRRIERRTGLKPLVRWTGETGGQTDRPHAHAMLFGVPASWVPLKQQKMLSLDWWKFGHCTVDKVTPQSAAYVVSYITDTQNQSDVQEGKKGNVIKSRPSPNIGRSYFEKWASDMQEGRKKHGARYTQYPDPETGYLEAPVMELEHRFHPLDQHWRHLAQQKGLLPQRPDYLVDFLTEMEVHKEVIEDGGPLYAEQAREADHQKQLRQNREVVKGREATQLYVEQNGYKFRINP